MRNAKTTYTWLGAVQTFIAMGALPAGFAMMTDPSGASMGSSTDLLRDSPFQDFFMPGIVLFTINGLGNLLGTYLSFNQHRSAGPLGILLGVLLIGWLSFQIKWIGFYPVLQVLYLLMGLLQVYLGYRLFKHVTMVNQRS